MITLMQIPMDSLDYAVINSLGHTGAADAMPKYEVSLRARFGKINKEDLIHYTDVATIDTVDLDVAFDCANGYGPSDVEVVDLQRHYSASVGDVFRLDGKFYQIMSEGFEEVV